jgi:hypothetical protein
VRRSLDSPAEHRPSGSLPQKWRSLSISTPRKPFLIGKPKTFRLYTTYLRRIVSEIFGIDGGKARWDYRAGGRDAWVKKVNAVRLAAITPAKLQKWRVAFIKRASHPGARASATRTANSYLRCARSLFSPKIVRFVSERILAAAVTAAVQCVSWYCSAAGFANAAGRREPCTMDSNAV